MALINESKGLSRVHVTDGVLSLYVPGRPDHLPKADAGASSAARRF